MKAYRPLGKNGYLLQSSYLEEKLGLWCLNEGATQSWMAGILWHTERVHDVAAILFKMHSLQTLQTTGKILSFAHFASSRRESCMGQ